MTIEPGLLIYVIIGAIVSIACLAYVFAGVFRTESAAHADHEAFNVEIAKEAMDRLREAKRSGQLGDEEFERAKLDIETSLADAIADSPSTSSSSDSAGSPRRSSRRDRWPVFILIPALLVAVAFIYREVGDIRAFDREFLAKNGAPGKSQAASQQSAQSQGSGKLPSIEEMLPRLESHLENNPDDGEGWKLLGTTYLRLQRFDDAQTALSNAHAAAPDDVLVMLQLADVRSVLSDGSIPADALELIDKALTIEPENIQGNWLRGMASQQAGDNQRAISHWQRIVPLLGDDVQSKVQIESMIAEAQGLVANGTATEPASDSANELGAQSSADAASNLSISVAVTLGEDLPNDLDPTTAVFVYAKAVDGPPVPLAVARLQLADLPTTVTLDDSLAMVPAFKISGFNNVIVGARISLTGNPIAQPGDWFAESGGVELKVTRALAVEINQLVNQ